jgi:hypothetical protein
MVYGKEKPRKSRLLSGGVALSMPVLVQHAALRHQDGMGITGTLAHTAANDAQERFNHFDFAIAPCLEDFLRANFETFPAAIA